MKLFGGGQKVETPPAPKPVRMPVETDPAVMQAAQRTRSAALMRQGRLSTIMTDQTKATTGSSGQKLGA
jgi:hypothetical protein